MQLRPLPLGFRSSPRAMRRALIASWYARHADDRPVVTLPREPYLPRFKPPPARRKILVVPTGREYSI